MGVSTLQSSTMSFVSTILFSSTLLVVVSCHEFSSGQCPQFTPVDNFDWSQFVGTNGTWFVTRQFKTRSSCLVNIFSTDEDGERKIEKNKQSSFRRTSSFRFKKIYSGTLTPTSTPGIMQLRYPLSFGSASFTVLDTDYTSAALVCECRDINMFIRRGHKRSCSILQRSPAEDASITDTLSAVLDNQLAGASDTLEKIDQDSCDDDPMFTLDVDQILGITGLNPPTRDEDPDVEISPVNPVDDPTTTTDDTTDDGGSEFDI